MKILLVMATELEFAPLQRRLLERGYKFDKAGLLVKNQLQISVCITGVGSVATTVRVGQHYARDLPELSINAGIAGSFNPDYKIGEVVEVVSEVFGDLGIEQKDGSFRDLFESGLAVEDRFPFQKGILLKPGSEVQFLPQAKGLTVNCVHGYKPSIEAVLQKYDVDVETMEGGAFLYSSLVHEVPFLQIRAISNRVEERNRDSWDIPLALSNLADTVVEMLEALHEA